MIVCPRCSRENQDHYKFCLGCGSELPRDAAHAPKPFTARTPPGGVPTGTGSVKLAAPTAVKPAPAKPPIAPISASKGAPTTEAKRRSEAAPVPARAQEKQPAAPVKKAGSAALDTSASAAMVTCGICGTANLPHFKFCGSCGAPLNAEPPKENPISGSKAPAGATARQVVGPRGALVILRPDGTEGEVFPLRDGETVIGRTTAQLFSVDTYLSPKTATFRLSGDSLVVRDEKSLNGVYYRVDRDVPVELEDGMILRIGQEIIRFEKIREPSLRPDGIEVMGSPNPGFLGRLCLLVGRNTIANSYAIPADGMHLGRERGDVIFPDDGYVSGLHCRIHGEGGRVMLTDVGSSNGTFIRIQGERALKKGAVLLMGQQLYRVDF